MGSLSRYTPVWGLNPFGDGPGDPLDASKEVTCGSCNRPDHGQAHIVIYRSDQDPADRADPRYTPFGPIWDPRLGPYLSRWGGVSGGVIPMVIRDTPIWPSKGISHLLKSLFMRCHSGPK